jgi:hypothetical protein
MLFPAHVQRTTLTAELWVERRRGDVIREERVFWWCCGTHPRTAKLAVLSTEDGIRQFLELCEFVRPYWPDRAACEETIQRKQAGWIALYHRLL